MTDLANDDIHEGIEPVVTVRSTLKDADVPKLNELVDNLLA